jgi:N-acetylglucosaminylphosphatidylinositol deacetylase
MASLPPHKAPEVNIDVLITFDGYGVSGHPNHISLFEGAQVFIKQIMHRHKGWECPLKLYTLASVNVARKYSSVLDCAATMLMAITRRKEKGSFPTPLLLVSSPISYRTAQNAMTKAHKSQMVWFRWGYISFSRYMMINDLKKEKSP